MSLGLREPATPAQFSTLGALPDPAFGDGLTMSSTTIAATDIDWQEGVLHLYDTPTRSVRELALRESVKVSIYLCGPTVYGPPHLGHGPATHGRRTLGRGRVPMRQHLHDQNDPSAHRDHLKAIHMMLRGMTALGSAAPCDIGPSPASQNLVGSKPVFAAERLRPSAYRVRQVASVMPAGATPSDAGSRHCGHGWTRRPEQIPAGYLSADRSLEDHDDNDCGNEDGNAATSRLPDHALIGGRR
jgi:hypothetical protein